MIRRTNRPRARWRGFIRTPPVAENKLEPLEFGALEPASSVIPLFSDLTQEEFNEFTKRMIIHTYPAGKTIISEGESGSSVYVSTRGTVGVVYHAPGEKSTARRAPAKRLLR